MLLNRVLIRVIGLAVNLSPLSPLAMSFRLVGISTVFLFVWFVF